MWFPFKKLPPLRRVNVTVKGRCPICTKDVLVPAQTATLHMETGRSVMHYTCPSCGVTREHELDRAGDNYSDLMRQIARSPVKLVIHDDELSDPVRSARQ